ncbi:unnamed protein product [Urochloa humidicola]
MEAEEVRGGRVRAPPGRSSSTVSRVIPGRRGAPPAAGEEEKGVSPPAAGSRRSWWSRGGPLVEEPMRRRAGERPLLLASVRWRSSSATAPSTPGLRASGKDPPPDFPRRTAAIAAQSRRPLPPSPLRRPAAQPTARTCELRRRRGSRGAGQLSPRRPPPVRARSAGTEAPYSHRLPSRAAATRAGCRRSRWPAAELPRATVGPASPAAGPPAAATGERGGEMSG